MVFEQVLVPSWSTVKSFADAGYQLYYVEELYRYRTFVVNNNNVIFTNLIFPSKFTERGVAAADQAQFTADYNDFVNNYKAGAQREPQLYDPGTLEIKQSTPIPVTFEESLKNISFIDNFSSQTIASGNTLTLITYTVPTDRDARITGVLIGGENYGEFELFINSSLKWKGRNSRVNANWTITFPTNMQVVDGDVIELKAKNMSHFSSNYEGKVFGYEYDA